MHIYQSFALEASAKCPGRVAPLVGRPFRSHASAALRFTRYLISFSCRLLKNMPQNQSFVSNCFGALDSSRFTSLSSRHRPRRGSPSGGRLTRAAFTRYLISFSCRLPKIHALIHSLVCTRFGALKCALGASSHNLPRVAHVPVLWGCHPSRSTPYGGEWGPPRVASGAPSWGLDFALTNQYYVHTH
jgi:hypothetical protein